MPPFPNHDKSLTNSTDTIILVITSLDQIKESEKFLSSTKATVIILFNKEDLLTETEKRKIKSNLQSKFKKYSFILFSSEKPDKIKLKKLKEKIFQTFPIIRIYTKEPKKEPSKEPMIVNKNTTVSGAAEKILKGMSKKIKKIRVWGPSSKFGGQQIGLNHTLKDKDIIEFQTI
jgi:ribosome-interacting GTPase 1